MDLIELSAAQTFSNGHAFVLSRAELDTRRPARLHLQDFYEMVWVQNGTVRLHHSAGYQDLTEGDLAFIAPNQPHGFQGRGAAPMVVSIAIRQGVIQALGNRHADLSGTAFWTESLTPNVTHRDIRQLAALNKDALALERSPRQKLYLEAFLLPLLVALDRPPEGMTGAPPEWLVHACTAARDPKVFRLGAEGFVAATGRTHPHVARTMRKHMGQTPSDYINTQRMQHAARMLTGTADPLPEIAADCGIPNLSHFHKLFRAAFEETPQSYRRSRQRDLIQPR